MDRIVVFLVRNDIWIYILSGLGLFWYISELLRARRQLRSARFSLERERGRRRQGNAITFVLFFAALAGIVAYVNLEVAPTLAPELLRAPTPTPDPLRPPLASPTPSQLTPRFEATATPPLVPTITLPPDFGPSPSLSTAEPPEDGSTPVGITITPPPPGGGEVASCPANANFTLPLDGAIVSGLVTFTGSASGPGFAFYKMEVNGPQTDGSWASLLGRTIFQPTLNGVLGSSDFTGWAPGSYLVRLVVVDDTSNETGSCTIRLEVGS